MCSKTVERLYYSEAEKQINLKERYAQVRKLGIDELAHRKGKKDYCCVLTDLDRGIQLDILPDRKKETLIAHFQSLGTEFCQQIEVVSCDIWEPYILVVLECFPQAQIVLDYFHVAKALNEALDSYRKSLRRTFPDVTAFKKLKWILYKRNDLCSEVEKQILQNAFEHSTELEEMYQLRNSFLHIFEYSNTKQQALKHIQQWVEDARFLQNRHWNKFIKTLSNWLDYILNFIELRITNAVTEGLNNLIRYLKRISFAIPNFEHMRLRVLANSG
jgi:transposase